MISCVQKTMAEPSPYGLNRHMLFVSSSKKSCDLINTVLTFDRMLLTYECLEKRDSRHDSGCPPPPGHKSIKAHVPGYVDKEMCEAGVKTSAPTCV